MYILLCVCDRVFCPSNLSLAIVVRIAVAAMCVVPNAVQFLLSVEQIRFIYIKSPQKPQTQQHFQHTRIHLRNFQPVSDLD